MLNNGTEYEVTPLANSGVFTINGSGIQMGGVTGNGRSSSGAMNYSESYEYHSSRRESGPKSGQYTEMMLMWGTCNIWSSLNGSRAPRVTRSRKACARLSKCNGKLGAKCKGFGDYGKFSRSRSNRYSSGNDNRVTTQVKKEVIATHGTMSQRLSRVGGAGFDINCVDQESKDEVKLRELLSFMQLMVAEWFSE